MSKCLWTSLLTLRILATICICIANSSVKSGYCYCWCVRITLSSLSYILIHFCFAWCIFNDISILLKAEKNMCLHKARFIFHEMESLDSLWWCDWWKSILWFYYNFYWLDVSIWSISYILLSFIWNVSFVRDKNSFCCCWCWSSWRAYITFDFFSSSTHVRI